MWYGGHNTTKQKNGTLMMSETVSRSYQNSEFREPILLLEFRSQLRK